MENITLIPNTPSTIGSWALLIAKAYESYGLCPVTLFSQVDMDLHAIQQNPDVRLPVVQMTKLWQLAVDNTQDPCFSLRLTQFFQANTYSALGLVIAASSNILEGLERTQKFSTLTSDAAVLSLEKNGNEVTLNADIPLINQPVADQAIEAFLTTIVCLFRQMSSREFSPKKVTFCHDKKQGTDDFQLFFNCEVAFNQPRNSLVFERTDITQPQILANASMVTMLEGWIEEYLSQFSTALFSTQLKAHILDKMLCNTVDLEFVAEHFNLGVRTLQRKLKSEDKCFNDILDECRHHMALKLLHEPQLALTEISYLLGFSDQSGFNRAFKRWTNVSPKTYRSSNSSISLIN